MRKRFQLLKRLRTLRLRKRKKSEPGSGFERILVVCRENGHGIMFNHRRVSRDEAVLSDVRKIAPTRNLYCSEYSFRYWARGRNHPSLVITRQPDPSSEGVFVLEDSAMTPDELKTFRRIIVYEWNRDYPSDVKFEVPNDYALVNESEFIGNSHEKITRRVYETKKD